MLASLAYTIGLDSICGQAVSSKVDRSFGMHLIPLKDYQNDAMDPIYNQRSVEKKIKIFSANKLIYQIEIIFAVSCYPA